MKYFFIALGIIALILIIVFRKQIAAFFGWGAPAEGSACTDSNGSASIIENGVCKEVVLPGDPDAVQRIVYPQYQQPYGLPYYQPGQVAAEGVIITN